VATLQQSRNNPGNRSGLIFGMTKLSSEELKVLADRISKFLPPGIHGPSDVQKKRALIKLYFLRLLDGLESRNGRKEL
jgi:hypothetical protein